MSTGHEHYAEAERLLTLAVDADDTPGVSIDPGELIALASVHARLACAAATADLALVTLAGAPVHTGTVDRTLLARRLAFGRGASA